MIFLFRSPSFLEISCKKGKHFPKKFSNVASQKQAVENGQGKGLDNDKKKTKLNIGNGDAVMVGNYQS